MTRAQKSVISLRTNLDKNLDITFLAGAD